jgi:CrcB protein
MDRLLWICVAGGIGTGARYLIALGAGKALGTSFPYGTLIVNLLGCFLIAIVMQLALTSSQIPPRLLPILTTGFLGGLTTYSSFNFETSTLFLDRGAAVAALYFGLTTLGSLAAGLAGLMLARHFVSG